MALNRIIAGLVLFFCATSAMSDIWQTLYSEKLQEAKNGNREAQYDVGTLYQNGRGVKTDRNAAIEWYKKAAAQGDTKAQSRLKLMAANTSRFNKTISQAAKGDQDSLYDLGNMHMKGVGTHVDYAKAISAFEQSASQGHVKAAYKLGLIYHDGAGVRASGKKAFKWFTQAAGNGYPAAQYYLGKLLADGTGVRQNKAEALLWFSKAIDGGFDQARGEMIAVSESMNAAVTQSTATATNAAPVARKSKTGKRTAAKKTRTARKATAPAKNKPDAGRYFVEDLVLATWSRDGKAVSYLPSAINNCRSDDDRIICFSDDQTRNSGANIIKFKTKAIITNFTRSGTFDVTYRNLVINARQQAVNDTDEALDEPGSLDDGGNQAYRVKTGWSNPHKLKCRMKNSSTVSCLKNNTYAFVLTSPTTLAVGD